MTTQTADAACQHDEPEGCFQLGRSLALGGAASPRVAMGRACELGHARGCETLAGWLFEGKHGDQSRTLARELIGEACDLGAMPACATSARWLIAASRDREHAQLIGRRMDQACEANVELACRDAGDVWLEGRVVVRDVVRAEHAYAAACSHRDAEACERLADLLGYSAARSATPERDDRYVPVAGALSAACDGGRLAACMRAGLLAMHGVGGDFASSHVAMVKACDGGVAEACLYAGRQLRFGHGVAADRDAALLRLRTACSAGTMLACTDLQTAGAL